MKTINLKAWMLTEKGSVPSVNPMFGGLLPIYETRKKALYAAQYHNGYLQLENKKARLRKFVIKPVFINSSTL